MVCVCVCVRVLGWRYGDSGVRGVERGREGGLLVSIWCGSFVILKITATCVQVRGHEVANIDPLGLDAWRPAIPPPELEPKFHGFEAR